MTKYLRSSTPMHERKESQRKLKKIIFLATEGAVTEPSYFNCLGNHLENKLIRLEILKRERNKGNSALTHVLDLLEECVKLRNEEYYIKPEDLSRLQIIPVEFSAEFISDFLNENTSKYDSSMVNKFIKAIPNFEIDLLYHKFLRNLNSKIDVFGIVIDCDFSTSEEKHNKVRREQIREIVDHCINKFYQFYITNPSFDFWLLLHLQNMAEITDEEKSNYFKNQKVSNIHTFTSKRVSKLANHRKRITKGVFEKFYLPNIKKAISQAELFSTKYPEILDNLGTNLPDLFKILDNED